MLRKKNLTHIYIYIYDPYVLQVQYNIVSIMNKNNEYSKSCIYVKE